MSEHPFKDLGLTDDEIVELENNMKLSAPIRIPTHKLSPEFEYRWIAKRPNVFQRRRGVGWTPVKASELKALVVEPYTVDDLHMGTHTAPDGMLALSDDLVFAKIPKRVAVAIRLRIAQINKDRLSAGRRRFHQAGEVAGVSTHEDF